MKRVTRGIGRRHQLVLRVVAKDENVQIVVFARADVDPHVRRLFHVEQHVLVFTIKRRIQQKIVAIQPHRTIHRRLRASVDPRAVGEGFGRERVGAVARKVGQIVGARQRPQLERRTRRHAAERLHCRYCFLSGKILD